MARSSAPILILLLLSGCMGSEGVQDRTLEDAPLDKAAAAPAQPPAAKLPPVPRMRPQESGDMPAQAGTGGDASGTPGKPADVLAAIAGARSGADATAQDRLLSDPPSKPVNTANAGSSSGERSGGSIPPGSGGSVAASSDPVAETSVQVPRKAAGADSSFGGANAPYGGNSPTAPVDPAGEVSAQEPPKVAAGGSPSSGAPAGVIPPGEAGASTAASTGAVNGGAPRIEGGAVAPTSGASAGVLVQDRGSDTVATSGVPAGAAEQPGQRVAAGPDPAGAGAAGDSGEIETLLQGEPGLPPAGAASPPGNGGNGATGVIPAGVGAAGQYPPAPVDPAAPAAADTEFSLLGGSGEPTAADLQSGGESRVAALTSQPELDSPRGLDVESLFGGDVMRYCAAMGEMGRYIGDARGRGEKQKGAIADATARAARAYDLPLDKRLSFSGKVYGRLLYRLDDKHSPQALGAYAEFACLTVRGEKKIVPADQDSERELNEGLRRCQSEAFTADDLRDCVFRRLTPVVDSRN